MDLAGFAALLRGRRQDLGLTKAEIARRYGHDPAAIGFYEDGVSRPQLFNVDALADAYALSRNQVRELVGYPRLPESRPSAAARLTELEDQLRRVQGELEAALKVTAAIREQLTAI